jgi:hypothetical protein
MSYALPHRKKRSELVSAHCKEQVVETLKLSSMAELAS